MYSSKHANSNRCPWNWSDAIADCRMSIFDLGDVRLRIQYDILSKLIRRIRVIRGHYEAVGTKSRFSVILVPFFLSVST